MARIHGICGVVLKASTAWQRDDSPDLSKTIKVLDQDLKKLLNGRLVCGFWLLMRVWKRK